MDYSILSHYTFLYLITQQKTSVGAALTSHGNLMGQLLLVIVMHGHEKEITSAILTYC